MNLDAPIAIEKLLEAKLADRLILADTPIAPVVTLESKLTRIFTLETELITEEFT